MTKTTKKSAAKTASVRKAMDKNIARNAAKRAPAKKTGAVSRTALGLARAIKTPKADPAPLADALAAFGVPAALAVGVAKLGTDAKAASKPAKAGKVAPATTKPAKAAKAATASEKPAATGVKAKIIAMIDRKGGVSAAEVCKAPRARPGPARRSTNGSSSRRLKVAKVRDADGVLRYSRGEPMGTFLIL